MVKEQQMGHFSHLSLPQAVIVFNKTSGARTFHDKQQFMVYFGDAVIILIHISSKAFLVFHNRKDKKE